MSLNNLRPAVAAPAMSWKRLGAGAQEGGASLMGITGAGEVGKTRFACAAPRACPEWFGERAVYIAIDPEAESLGSVLPADRANMEVIGLDFGKDVVTQLLQIYGFPWAKEGFKLVITDTMTVASHYMLEQLAYHGKFTKDGNIELGGGIKQPTMGDFGGVQTLIGSLLRRQKQSGLHHMTLYHEQEVRPEAGKPGEPIGGPATVGKASVRALVNWHTTMLHLVKRQKRRTDLAQPIQYERVVHTTGHGIWQAKLRTGELNNPVPEILMDADPINVWRTLQPHLKPESTNK